MLMYPPATLLSVARHERESEQLQIVLDGPEAEWLKLENLSSRERALARELDDARAQLYEHARAMKRAGIANAPTIAERLHRNRQRVNAWMRTKQPAREEKSNRDDGWIDPEAHVPL
jgi:hypothetical protein